MKIFNDKDADLICNFAWINLCFNFQMNKALFRVFVWDLCDLWYTLSARVDVVYSTVTDDVEDCYVYVCYHRYYVNCSTLKC